jgi:phosphate-selective porin OprO/OprP
MIRERRISAGAQGAARAMRRWTAGLQVAAVAAIAIVASFQRAAAQQGSAAPPRDTATSVEDRINELDQQIRVLKRLRELDQDSAAAKAKETPVTTAGKQGFLWRSPDGAFQLRVRGYAQADGRLFSNDIARPLTNNFELRRARPILEATVYRYFDIRIMPDFGQGQTRLFDAYATARIAPELRVTAGKFKAPIGLERLQSATDLLFIERAFPAALAPNRDVGLALSGNLGGQLVQYDVGVFNGSLDGALNDGDQNDSKDLDARLFFTPFDRSDFGPLKGLSIGVAGTLGAEHGTAASPALPTYKSPGQNTFFSYRGDGTAAGTVVANGRRRRIAPQGYYHWGRVGLLGEWIRSTQVATLGANTQTLRATAWQAAGSFTLTGEDASYKGVTPRHPIEAGRGGRGAVELVGRYSALIIDPVAFPTFANPASSAQRAREWAAGVNWYPERGVKVSVNYSQTKYLAGAAAGGDREKEEAILTQLQLAF